MKKSFRNKSGGNQGSSRSGRQQGRDSGHGTGQGRSEGSFRGGKGSGRDHNRKDVKNARSLSDVVGGGGSRSGGGNWRPTPGGNDRGSQGSASSSSSSGRGAVKMAYITSFQPPESLSSSSSSAPTPNRPTPNKPTPRVSDARPEPTVDTPRRFSQSAATETATESAFRDTNRKTDFRWPKSRVQTPAATETKERSGRGGKSGGARVTGVVKRHPDGFGFLLPDDATHPDVYISRQSMTGVMTNDRVEVEVYRPKSQGRNGEDRLAGEITKVLSRATKRVVGKYLPVDRKYGVILDDGRGWGADLRIAAEDSMNAQEGDMVAVEVDQYPDDNKEFLGRVVAILGDIDDPLNDVLRVVHQQGIPTEFSREALHEARRFGTTVTEADAKGRESLLAIPIITIDGATARDFDDAIYVEQREGGFKLVVAIADVSHYVLPGTPLDQEAYERGTSTYFPNHVNPMLPEELSNELCSLKPDVKRLCFACEMQINFNGEVEKYRFFEAVMQSKARVTYGEAQEVINGSCPPRLQQVKENILRAADLAKILMQKRFREGSLDLEIGETQVVVDATGETTDIIKSERLFAHRLIEELMLVTNICTARFLDEAEIPGIYRIHEEPDPDNIKALQRYLWNFGGNKSVSGGRLQKKLTKALQSMEGRPEAPILNILTLRTMRQAQYSNENVGHFGLGFSHYTHFTSPIRRYPDLIAHRLIKSQLYPKYRSMQMNEDELASASTFLSACEQRSTKAERQVISIKKARFIKRFVGEEFDGIISSVTKFGVFVMLRQYDVDGLIKIENLGDDRFIFDDENLRLIGPRIGVRYTIGDVVRVKVAGANPEQGKVDFELAQMPNAVHDEDHDDHDQHEGGERDWRESRNQERGRGGNRDRDRARGQGGHARDAKGNRKSGMKGKPANGAKGGAKKEGLNPQKRGETPNDRRGIRKKRVSKRRGKN